MKVKKTLAILEILCPAFFAAEAEDGSIKYNTPTGHLLYLPTNIIRLYYAIWSPDNDVLTATEKMVRLFINLALSIAFLPLTIVVWIISQLVFAMHYDHRQKIKGRKSCLLMKYLAMLILIGSLFAMMIHYSISKEDIYIDLTPAVASMPEPESESDKVVVRKNKRLVDTESGHKQSNDSEDCISSTSVEPEPEITTAATTSEIVNPEAGYTIKRKER